MTAEQFAVESDAATSMAMPSDSGARSGVVSTDDARPELAYLRFAVKQAQRHVRQTQRLIASLNDRSYTANGILPGDPEVVFGNRSWYASALGALNAQASMLAKWSAEALAMTDGAE